MPLYIKGVGANNFASSKNRDLPNYDLFSINDVLLHPGKNGLVETGLEVWPDPFVVGIVFSVEKMLLKDVEVIPDFFGQGFSKEVVVRLANRGSERVWIYRGTHIARLLFIPFAMPNIKIEYETESS
jgi:dUTPase